MQSDAQVEQGDPVGPDHVDPGSRPRRRLTRPALAVSLLLNALLLVLWVSERQLRGDPAASGSPSDPAAAAVPPDPARLLEQVNPAAGFEFPAHHGDLGPRLIQAGAIDPDRFIQLYEESGRPLSTHQLTALLDGSEAPIVISRENSHFLLNLLWALGLTNRSPILDAGLMMTYSQGDIGRFASTGGWTLGARPATDLYSSTNLVELTAEQQGRVERVASRVYRPCCDNHAAFPDCNHGMAMLGLLQLLASQGASEAQMFEAAKHANSFWFPQQAMQVAAFFRATQGLAYAQVPAAEAVGADVFSATGFGQLNRWLDDNGLLPEAPRQDGGCGV